MSKSDTVDFNEGRVPVRAADTNNALQWFAQSAMHHKGWVRSLILPDFAAESYDTAQTVINTLRAAGFNVMEITGAALFKQAEYLWDLAVKNASFGRPVASKLELDIGGADFLFLRNLEAPELPQHLWYFFHYVIYVRALAGKPSVFTTPLSLDELIVYGAGCEDVEYVGRKITWEKIVWFLRANAVDIQLFLELKKEGLPIMLASEYALFKAIAERNLKPVAQHPLGQYVLDIALIDKERKLDIECDLFDRIDTSPSQAVAAKKNLVLVSDGWKVVRFTISEVLSNTSACVDAVEEVWQQGRKKSSVGRLISGQASTVVAELPVDDDTQRLVITHGSGPAAVIGGAGTGKTSCAIHRAAFLIVQGVNPERILVISYSPETVKHFRAELEKLVDKQTAQRVDCYSWHDLGLKILKDNLAAIRRKLPLKIESNPQKVIQRLLAKYKKELDPATIELSEELDEFAVAELISLYKANLVTSRYVREKGKGKIDELVAKVYQGYEEQLQKANKIDKDDQISLAALLLADQQEVRARYQHQYDHVIVDEYQDATAAGDLLARLLAFPQDGVYFFGDEDEAVCESKGGLPRLMSELSIRLPNARCFTLEQNWRSHPEIIEHAGRVADKLNRRRIKKTMRSGWGSAPSAAIVGPLRLQEEHAEAAWIADEVQLLLDSGKKPEEICVLYRYHRFALIIEEALARKGIRCLASHPEAGLVPDEIGDAMAFLRLVMDPDGPKARESFERVCQLKENAVDPKLSADIARFAEMNNLSYLKAIEIYSEASAKPACHDLEQLVHIIRKMNQEKLPPAESISLLKRTQKLGEFYKNQKVPPGVNYEPLRALSELEEEARQYKTVAEFVKSHISSRQSGTTEAMPGTVSVLTVHEAKGKEFPIVFMVCLANGLFPSSSSSDEEEERRLFYVAMTRAREVLYLSFPERFNNTHLEPSLFLAEAGLPFVAPPMTAPAIPAEAAGSSGAVRPAVQSPPPGGHGSAIPLRAQASSPAPAGVFVSLPGTAGSLVPSAVANSHMPVQVWGTNSGSAGIAPPSTTVKNGTPIEPSTSNSANSGQELRRPSAPLPDSANDAAAILSQAIELPEGEQGNKAKSMEELLAEIEPGVRPGDQLIDQATVQQLQDIAPPIEQHDAPGRSGHQSTSEAYLNQYQSDYWLQIQSQPAFIRPHDTPPTFADNAQGQSVGYEPVDTGGNGENSNQGSREAYQQSIPFPTPVQAIQCRACGSMIEFGSRYCGECGVMAEASAAPPLRGCHLCGAPLDHEARFCGECGSNQLNGAFVRQQVPTAAGMPYAPAQNYGAPTQRGWVVRLLRLLER